MNMITNGTIDEMVQETLYRKGELNESLVESTAEEVSMMKELLEKLTKK